MLSVELTHLSAMLDSAGQFANVSQQAKEWSSRIHDAIWNTTVSFLSTFHVRAAYIVNLRSWITYSPMKQTVRVTLFFTNRNLRPTIGHLRFRRSLCYGRRKCSSEWWFGITQLSIIMLTYL